MTEGKDIWDDLEAKRGSRGPSAEAAALPDEWKAVYDRYLEIGPERMAILLTLTDYMRPAGGNVFDDEGMATAFLRVVRREVDARVGAIFLTDESKQDFRPLKVIVGGESTTVKALADSVIRRALAARTLQCSEDALRDEHYRYIPSVLATQPGPMIAAPLLSLGQCVGVLYLDRAPGAPPFSKERRFVEAVCQHAGRAMAQGQLYRAYLDTQGLGGEPLSGGSIFKRAFWLAVHETAPVLILGEKGTGKTWLAQAIALHPENPRCERGWKELALSETSGGDLFSADLFGHSKHAFTGAGKKRLGLAAAVDGGTLFLDEITRADGATLGKLLRLVEQKKIRPMGEDDEIQLDVRIIAATNADIEKRVAEGNFPADLYDRLKGIVLRIPPLRERPEDIPRLIQAALRKEVGLHGGACEGFSPDVVRTFMAYSWPGNVRELFQAVELMVASDRSRSVLGMESVPEWLGVAGGEEKPRTMREAMEAEERRILVAALAAGSAGGLAPQGIAAELGISKASLYRLLEKHGLKWGGGDRRTKPIAPRSSASEPGATRS